MNSDKINKWLELAKSFTGNDFWTEMFDRPGISDLAGMTPFSEGKSAGKPALFPAADVLTTEGEIVIVVDLPGVAKEDIQLSINDEALFIKGEAKPLFPPSQYTLVTSERFTGSFERPIGLPVKIDGQKTKIRAAFHQGTLIVRIPSPPVWKKVINID